MLDVALNATDPIEAWPRSISERIDELFKSKISFMDVGTFLVNGDYFKKQIKTVLEHKQFGVILFIDLNKFKPINDTYGHNAGDEVLRVVAERLKTASSRNSIVARLGGDEFGIMLNNARKEHAMEIKQRIQDAVKAPIKLDSCNGQVVEVEASIGSVVYPGDGVDAEELLHKADVLMYEDKKGKGR